jgi:hypothetical protein
VSDGLGILLAFAAVIAPLALAWVLFIKTQDPRGPSQLTKRKKQ